jgi:hypothetical protein
MIFRLRGAFWYTHARGIKYKSKDIKYKKLYTPCTHAQRVAWLGGIQQQADL